MKQATFNELFGKIQSELADARNAGQKEYAHGEVDDVFNNFNRVAAAVGVDRKAVLATYMLKHVDGIMAYIKGHKSQREDVRGRIKDNIVYLMLLWGMVEEEESYSDLDINPSEGQIPTSIPMQGNLDKLKIE